MPKPDAPSIPLPPLRSLGEDEFVVRTEAWFSGQFDDIYPYYVASVDFIDETNDNVQAAAVAANIFDVPLDGFAGAVIAVNDAEDGFVPYVVEEYTVTPFAETLLDDADAAAMRGTIDASQSPLDEDDFASNSNTRPPTQQSVKAYVDGSISGAAPSVIATWQYTSSITNIDLSWVGSWSHIRILISNVTTSGEDNDLRVSFNGGATYISTGYSGAVTDDQNSRASTTAVPLTRGVIGSVSGAIDIFNADARGLVSANTLAGTGARSQNVSSLLPSGAVNAVRFIAAGSATSGSITVIGIY